MKYLKSNTECLFSPIKLVLNILEPSAKRLECSANTLELFAWSLECLTMPLELSASPLECSAMHLESLATSLERSARSLESSAMPLELSASLLECPAMPLERSAIGLDGVNIEQEKVFLLLSLIFCLFIRSRWCSFYSFLCCFHRTFSYLPDFLE